MNMLALCQTLVIAIGYFKTYQFLALLSGKGIPVRKLFELKSDEKCIVVGTLFKHMDLKPSILKEISEDVRLKL